MLMMRNVSSVVQMAEAADPQRAAAVEVAREDWPRWSAE
jgi:hypothetical protein